MLLIEAYIGREELGVNDNSLDIIQILVMFQCLSISLNPLVNIKSLPSERAQPFQRDSQS
jgi:hypothetical protein